MGAVRTGSTGSMEPVDFWESLNKTYKYCQNGLQFSKKCEYLPDEKSASKKDLHVSEGP